MWSDKYKPKSSGEIFGSHEVLDKLRGFVKNYVPGKALLLYGKTGVGKTCLVHALASELGFEVMEINASDFRNKAQINSIVGSSMKQRSLFAGGKIILADEIDGLSGIKDRGGASELASLIKDSSFPIVLTANDPYHSKLKPLKSKSILVAVEPPSHLEIRELLRYISLKEGLGLDGDILNDLSLRSDGDFRSAVLGLQSYSASAGDVDYKEGSVKITDALRLVLKSKNPENVLRAFDNVGVDYREVLLWLEENIPKEYKNAEDLARAFDMLSRADVFNGRIKKWQYWRFLAYIYNYYSAGVALAKREKYSGVVSYGPSRKLLKLWQAKMRNGKRDSIAVKIASYTHTSTSRVLKDSYPYLKRVLSDEELAFKVGLDEDEIAFLRAQVY